MVRPILNLLNDPSTACRYAALRSGNNLSPLLPEFIEGLKIYLELI